MAIKIVYNKQKETEFFQEKKVFSNMGLWLAIKIQNKGAHRPQTINNYVL